jgi:hypothetical protein
MTFTSAKQVEIRQSLSSNQQLAFDVGFSQKRLSKFWFGLLWGFFGFFFGHTIYFFLKTKDLSEEQKTANMYLWIGPVMLWIGTLFGNPVMLLIAIVAITGNGLYYLLSGEFVRLNDKIAERIASSLKRREADWPGA